MQRETLYVGNVEIITDNPDSNPVTTYKRYIGGSVIVTESDTDSRVEYTHKDHLGSLHAITDVNGNLVTQLSFGAFGERRNHLDPNILLTDNPAENTTTRGYTGHEQIDSLDLIHMNARTYDAGVGQMMQADSIIPDIANSQSLNRFAYVYNNPLSYSDPTGNAPRLRDSNASDRSRQRVIEKQARSGDRGAIIKLRELAQQSQGDNRTMQIAGDSANGTFAGSFELVIGRSDSAEDEGDHLNSTARQEHLFRSLIFGEDSVIALRPLVVTGIDTGIGGEILFTDFRDSNIRAIQLEVQLTGNNTFANTLGATDTIVTTAIFLVGAGETAVGLAAVGALFKGGLRALPGLLRSADDVAKEITPVAGQKIFRVFGDDAVAGGASFSPVNPANIKNFREAAGLPSGGASGANNSAQFVLEATLLDSSKVVKVRNALSLDGNKGGITEFIIPNALKNGAIKVDRVSGVNPEF